MSESDQTAQTQLNNFSVIEQSINKYFVDIENSVPRFQQELFDLQNECYKTWKNAVISNMSLQKEFVNKTGFFIPDVVQKIIESMNDEFVKARSVRDNVSIATIDSMKKNIKMWNDSASIFLNLNKKIMQYWILTFTPKPES